MPTDAANAASKTRLWFVTELYYPEETSTGYYLTKTAEGLADDFDVKVICGQPTYSSRGVRAASHETHKGVEIFRAAGTTFDKNSIPLRVINMLTLGASVFWKAVLKFRHRDKVVVVTTPPSMPFVVAFAAILRSSDYVLLIHDNYPEILFAAGKSKDSSFFAKVMAFANRWLYKNAAKIVVVGRDMEVLLQEKTRGLEIPIAVIPNWAELESVEPRPRDNNALINQLGLREKLVILYAGNMGYPNDIETILEAAGNLREHEGIHFVFLGSGVKKTLLTDSVRRLGLENVTILDPRPRSEQIIFLNACDIAVVSLVPKMLGVSMPSRTYNILAAGKPILGLVDPKSEVAMVIDENQIGWHIPPGDAARLVDVITEIEASRDRLTEMGERARKAAIDSYSLAVALEKYRQELSKV